MDDSVDQAGTETPSGLTRRQMIGRTAAAGAVVWTAPILLSSTAHAAGTLGGNVCGEDGNDRPDYMTFRYSPAGGWIWDVCTDTSLSPPQLPDTRDPQPGDADFPPTLPPCVYLVADTANGWRFSGAIAAGGTGTIDGLGNGQPDVVFYFVDCADYPDELVLIQGVLNGTIVPADVSLGSVTVHVSCSQPLCVGDTYGALQLIAGGKGTPPSP